MQANSMERFRESLTARKEKVVEWLQTAPDEEKARIANGVMESRGILDETTVVPEIDRALERVNDGTFGRCELCDHEADVEEERLVLDFTTTVCLDHYNAVQLRALERDLELAAQVQQQLFPQWVPALDHVQIATHATAGRIVGGDYFDFFRFRNDEQGAVIADVMGAGLPAGMLMSNLQASLRILGPDYETPDVLATRLNELFRYNLRLIRFISMVLLSFDPERQRIIYTNAGHNPPLFRRAGDGSHRWLTRTGPAIGLMPEASYETEVLDTNPGDVLVLYTDGLLETRGVDGVPFGEEGLLSFLEDSHEKSADELVSRLWNTIRRYSDGDLNDDVALVVAKFV